MDSMLLSSDIFGSIETQIAEGGEADLHKHLKECEKNPDHKEFIPYTHFNIGHLPEGLKDAELYEYIRAEGHLTVRVDVRMVSPHRPKFWPKSIVPYPSYELKKKESLRYGSGEVYNVIKFENGIGLDVRGIKFFRQYSSCVCQKCSQVHSQGQSGEPSSVWWEIIIRTATHVVFDHIEAEHTKCKLNYDEQHHPGRILENFSVYDQTIDTDSFLLKLVICEGDLGDELFAKRQHCRELWSKVSTKYRNSETKLCFIVSHPHGCSKQVSIGEWLTSVKEREYNKDYDLTSLTYTTCTCPGSSGAYVHSISLGGSHVHTGCNGSGINYSGHGIQIKK